MTTPSAPHNSASGTGRSTWRTILQWLKDPRVRALITLALLAVIIFLARDHYHFLEEGWEAMLQANNWYILAAVVAMGLSMVAQAEVIVVLLRSADVPVKRTSANALALSANAWSSSFPGGPAISAAMIFREQMKWGASAVVASWYMVISGALSGAGMAILGFGAVFFLQANVHIFSLTLSIIGLAALTLAANWVAHHPDKVKAWLLKVVTWFNRKRHKPEDRFHEQVSGFASQLQAVDLTPKRLGYSILLSLFNWLFEILCLFLCIMAIGAEPNIAGAVIAFITAKLVGQAQITPGGLGPVDIMLTGMLVGTAGLSSGQAFAAVIVFRMISFVLLTIIGWLVFLWTFVRAEEAERNSDDTSGDDRQSGSSTYGRTSQGPTVRQITDGTAARRMYGPTAQDAPRDVPDPPEIPPYPGSRNSWGHPNSGSTESGDSWGGGASDGPGTPGDQETPPGGEPDGQPGT